MSRLTAARRHRATIEAKRPDLLVPCDRFRTWGQSNVTQAIPTNLGAFVTGADVAYGVTRYPQPDRGLVGPFANGTSVTPHFGQAHSWAHFAQEWYDLTGRRSIWGNYGFAGTPLLKISNANADQRWSLEEMEKCMVGDLVFGGDIQTRNQLNRQFNEAYTLNPRFTGGKNYVIWSQGEADASPLTANLSARYEQELDAMFTYGKEEFGIDAYLMIEVGREGLDEAAVAVWEPTYQKVRDAQNAVAAKRSDTHIIFSGCKELGTPFNTITTDANGYWASGWQSHDGVHGALVSNEILGKTAARNAVQILGL